MSLTDDLDPSEKIMYKKKAYNKLLNMEPAMQTANTAANTRLGKEGLQGVYAGVTQGGFEGRKAADTAMDTTSLQLAKARGEQAKEKDALAVQGAGEKEAILSDKNAAYLNQFNRQTQDQEDQLNRAVAERAFDLGITAKELAFHVNSKVADIGMDKLKEDYDAGNVSKQELQTVVQNLAKAAQQAKIEADAILAELKRKGLAEATAEGRARGLALLKKLMDKQKENLQNSAKAANISSIISGGASIAGGIVGFVGSGGNPLAGAAGMTAGKGIADIGIGAYNAAQ